jgi:hypothetical protein
MPRDNSQLVAGTVQNVAEAMVEMREVIAQRPPPQVTVNVPEQPVTVKVPEALPPHFHINFPPQATPEVRFDVPQLPAPVVNVKQPVINVLPPTPRAYECVVTSRDENGFILGFTVTPV